MSRHDRHIANLCIIAKDLSPVANASIAAAIVLNNRIVSYGNNSYKTHPFQKRYGKNGDAICLHSEIDAIFKSLKRISLKDLSMSTLYIARMKKDSAYSARDSWGNAKPCIGCQRAIANFGIKKVYFTTDENGIFECL
jgi:deoxycytidylate deaminase